MRTPLHTVEPTLIQPSKMKIPLYTDYPYLMTYLFTDLLDLRPTYRSNCDCGIVRCARTAVVELRIALLSQTLCLSSAVSQ